MFHFPCFYSGRKLIRSCSVHCSGCRTRGTLRSPAACRNISHNENILQLHFSARPARKNARLIDFYCHWNIIVFSGDGGRDGGDERYSNSRNFHLYHWPMFPSEKSPAIIISFILRYLIRGLRSRSQKIIWEILYSEFLLLSPLSRLGSQICGDGLI